MIYATRSDIEALYGADELRIALNLARDAEFSAEDITRIDQALSESGGQIDAYIGVHHSLPLPLVPEVLRAFAIDMAIYRLAMRTGRPRDELRTRYEDAVKFLTAVSSGKASLPGIDTNNEPDPTAASGSSDDVQFITTGRRTSRNSGLMT